MRRLRHGIEHRLLGIAIGPEKVLGMHRRSLSVRVTLGAVKLLGKLLIPGEHVEPGFFDPGHSQPQINAFALSHVRSEHLA